MDVRPSGIGEAMERIVSHGWGFNADSGCGWSPLMESVGWCDAPMTEFLLQNGADANLRPDMEDGERNYYLDDLDIAFLNER